MKTLKTLKELQGHGINYLIGYTDALADLAKLLIEDPDYPELYEPTHNQQILKVLNEYISKLLKEGMEGAAK